MAVTLTIEDARNEMDGPLVADVPDGSRVLVRRSADGADVLVLPCETASRSSVSAEARGHLIAVRTFTVERNRPGCAEILIGDMDGAEWRLFIGGDMGLDLAACLRGGEPVERQSPHESALARRANAEAQLVELEVAEKTRAARARDRSAEAGRLWVEFNADVGRASICAADHHGGPETKIEVSSDQILWLLEQLLHARRSLDKAAA